MRGCWGGGKEGEEAQVKRGGEVVVVVFFLISLFVHQVKFFSAWDMDMFEFCVS